MIPPFLQQLMQFIQQQQGGGGAMPTGMKQGSFGGMNRTSGGMTPQQGMAGFRGLANDPTAQFQFYNQHPNIWGQNAALGVTPDWINSNTYQNVGTNPYANVMSPGMAQRPSGANPWGQMAPQGMGTGQQQPGGGQAQPGNWLATLLGGQQAGGGAQTAGSPFMGAIPQQPGRAYTGGTPFFNEQTGSGFGSQ